MLQGAQKLKEIMDQLADKKDSSAKDLEKKIDDLESVTLEQVKYMLQQALKRMQQSQDTQDLQKNSGEFKEAIKSNTAQDKQEQDKMLDAVQKLKETLESLLNKKDSNVKDLEKKIDNLENVTAEQIKQLQDSLEKMQQSKDSRELEKASEEFKDAIKSNTQQDKQEQDKMLESAQKLKNILDALLKKNEPTAAERKDIDKINEKINQAAEIKQQFLMSQASADILDKIEKLKSKDAKKAQALKGKLEEMRKSNSSDEVEKIILDLKNILNSETVKEDKKSMLLEGDKQQRDIYILSSPLIVSQGITVPLRVIAVYKNGYIKELTSDLEWFSTDKQVAWVDDLNFLHPLAKGRIKIRAVYKGLTSQEAEVDVVEDIDAQTVQTIKQELD